MESRTSDAVARYIPSLFGSKDYSDCNITFYLDLDGLRPIARKQAAQLSRDDPEVEGEPTANKPRLHNASALSSNEQELHILGEPLAAHQFVLHACSERFAAELQRWQGGAPGDAQATLGDGLSVSAAPVAASRPVLRVPLGSPAELPAAVAALRFAYTGTVEAGSVTEALEVRRQAAYLRIEGCGAACMEAIRELLGATAAAAAAAEAALGEQQQPTVQGAGVDPAAGNAGPQGAGSVANGGSGGRTGPRTASALGPVPPPLLEFFRASALWPEEAEEPSFAAVLAFAKQKLVEHFGDALLVINLPFPREALTSLPAVALEALLESDDFGTDDEASVLLMLAMWMRGNVKDIDEETRTQLCGKVRLVQMNQPYLTGLLPVLAADHEAGPPMDAKEEDKEEEEAERSAVLQTAAGPPGKDKQPAAHAGWFPITMAEAAFIASAETDAEHDALMEAAEDAYDLESPWYDTQPRRQCLPEGGRTYEWSAPQKVLEKALEELEPEGVVWLSEVGGWKGGWFASGFVWDWNLCAEHGVSGLSVTCSLPGVYSGRISATGSLRRVVTASPPLRAHLAVRYWEGGAQKEESLRISSVHRFAVGSGRGWFLHFARVQQPAATVTGTGRPLDAWAAYLRQGKVSGTFKLLPPPQQDHE